VFINHCESFLTLWIIVPIHKFRRKLCVVQISQKLAGYLTGDNLKIVWADISIFVLLG
jgi:hypothetical protein